MATGSTFKVLGLKEAVRAFQMVQANASKALVTATKAGALIVQNDAKSRAPYKTGNLRRSIHMETLTQSPTDVVVAVGTDVVYAAKMEFENEPYLRPALDENQAEIAMQIELAVNRATGVR